jgi:protocatechuate 3,4-dioxygenase beta subunit
MSNMASLSHCLIASFLLVTALTAQQPPRDPGGTPGPGTVSIAGTVVTDDAEARPIRKALVSISAGGRGSMANVVVTDDDGRFAFSSIAAGRYQLSAFKPGYVNASYGAARPGRPGTPVQLGPGQQVTAITIKMARGGVVTGTIFDQNGEPLPSARVTLMRYVFSQQSGERTLQPFGAAGTTDDRGTYRIYGVAPGEYVAQLNSPFSLPGELRQTTAQSLQSALQQSRGSGPGGANAAAANAVQAPTVGYAPLFYPGTSAPANATMIKLGPGEERSGVDIQFQLVPTARIEGTVVGPDGAPASNVQMSVLGAGPSDVSMSNILSTMFGGNRPGPDGTFTLSGIAPGHYTVAARTGGPGRGGSAGGPAAPVLWAATDVDVNGQDVTGVRLTLEPGMSLSGRVAFEGALPPPADLTTLRVTLTPVLTGNSVAMLVPAAPADAQGRFTFGGVTPGRYRLGATSPSGWALKTARVKDRDTLDIGLDVRPNDNMTDALLTFSDRSTTLSGTFQDATGRAASDYFIIVYAADRMFWSPPSRRVAMTRPGIDGKFTIRDLPSGNYLLAAVTDAEPGEWMDPAFLAQLVTASIKVTLAEGETRTQDIRIAGRF